MDIKDRRGIREEAAQALEQTSDCSRKRIWLYALVLVGVSLLLTTVNFILGRQIGDAEGLSAMDLRTMLETVRTLLQYASALALPFWEFGLIFVAMKIARKQQTDRQDLFQGFRRFGTVFLLLILQSVLMNLIMMICLQISALIFMATPMSQQFRELIGPFLAAGPDAVMEPEMLGTAVGQMLPMIAVFLIMYLVILTPVFYHFRMAQYLAMDTPRTGAFACLSGSWKMMRSNCVSLFRLDLSFWWFYVLQGLINAVCYGEVLFEAVGVKLPMSSDVAYFVFYIAYAVLNLALIVWAKLRVETTYAVAYDRVRAGAQERMLPYGQTPEEPLTLEKPDETEPDKEG